MKKLFLAVSIVFILFSCDNGGMSQSENGNPDSTPAESYYPFEVSNISVVEDDDNVGYKLLHEITWDNPTDSNFSHVLFSATNNRSRVDRKILDPGQNAYICDVIGALYNQYTVTIVCVDKEGNESKGVEHSYYSKYYDPNAPVQPSPR